MAVPVPMILICDNCHVRYLVPSHAIGADGRRVRCSNCGHEWVQKERDDHAQAHGRHEPADIIMEPIPESVRPVPETLVIQNLPRKFTGLGLDKARLIGAAAGMGVMLLLLAVTIPVRAGIAELWPPSAAIYETLGFAVPLPGEGLMIDHVTAAGAVDEKGARIIRVAGRIANLRNTVNRIPPVAVTLKRPDGKALAAWTAARVPPLLGPQAETAFSTSYPLPKEDVKNVTVGFAQ